jgi:hypothetical protein
MRDDIADHMIFVSSAMMLSCSTFVSESVACVIWNVSRVSENPVSRVPAPT